MNQENYPQTSGHGISPETSINEEEIDLLDLIGVLFKHRRLIIGITVLAAVFVLVYSVISLKLPPEKSYLPNLYKSYSTVKINDSSSGGGLSSMLDSSGLGSLAALAGVSGGGSSNSALAEKLATSNTFIDILAEEFQLDLVYDTSESKFPKTDLRRIIRDKLRLEADDTTGTMTIGYEDIDPELATRIANRMVNLLDAEFLKIDQVSNQSQKGLLETKLQDVQMEIDTLQADYLAFLSRNKIIDMETLITEITSATMELKSQMITIDAEIEAMENQSGIVNPKILEKKREKKGLELALKTLEEQGDYNLPPLNGMPDLLIEEQKLKRSVEIQVAIYKGLLEQYEVTKLTDKGTGPTFQLLEKAEVPEIKSGPGRGKLCVIVTMAGFFLSLFGAFLLEFWQNLKNDPERMKKLKGEV